MVCGAARIGAQLLIVAESGVGVGLTGGCVRVVVPALSLHRVLCEWFLIVSPDAFLNLLSPA